jgi:hypothetical protein
MVVSRYLTFLTEYSLCEGTAHRVWNASLPLMFHSFNGGGGESELPWYNELAAPYYRSFWHVKVTVDYLCLYSSFGLRPLFQFSNLYTVGRTHWTGDQPAARPLPTHRTAQIQNKRTQTSMPQEGFEPAITAFERAKAVHALDFAATVIGHGR